MAPTNHTILPSLWTLEATLNIASDGFGVFAKISLVSRWILIQFRKEPPKTWHPPTIQFCLSFGHWKWHATLPMLVYGVFVQNILVLRSEKKKLYFIFNVEMLLFIDLIMLSGLIIISLSNVFHESISWVLINLGYMWGHELGGKETCHAFTYF